MTNFDSIFAPLESWLVLLADGWRFVGDIAQPMCGPHGAYSSYLWMAA